MLLDYGDYGHAGILKAFSVVHQSVEQAAKKTMETVRPCNLGGILDGPIGGQKLVAFLRVEACHLHHSNVLPGIDLFLQEGHGFKR